MIALATVPQFNLPVVGKTYEIDYETGLGVSRRLVRVDKVQGEQTDFEGKDQEPVVVATTHDEVELVYSDAEWDNLNPEVFA